MADQHSYQVAILAQNWGAGVHHDAVVYQGIGWRLGVGLALPLQEICLVFAEKAFE